MKTVLIYSLLFTCLLSSAEEGRTIIAVVPFEQIAVDGVRNSSLSTVGSLMEDQLQMRLSDAEQISLVERADLDAVLREQSLTISGLVDPAAAARVGHLLKADVIIVGRLRPLDEKKMMANVRAVQVKNAQVMWSSDAQGDVAALAGQAASMGAELSTKVVQTPQAETAEGNTSLRAARHHERASALLALGASEEAVAEELKTLSYEPTLHDAEVGFLKALASAGFKSLAAAEAKAVMERTGENTNAALQELAQGSGAPEARTRETSDSSTISGLRKFVQLVERSSRSLPTNQQSSARIDEIAAWTLLGDAYVRERRDRKAAEAYQQALDRVWALRASDTVFAGDQGFKYADLCDTAAKRAIEYSVNPGDELLANLRVALLRKQRLPDSCVAPLRIYRSELPIKQRLAMQLSQQQPRPCLLLEVDFQVLPAGSRVTAAAVFTADGQEVKAQNSHHIPSAWVAEEATTIYARKDVPWIAYGERSYNRELGRDMFGHLYSNQKNLAAMLNICQELGERSHGVALINIRDHITAEVLRGVRVEVDIICPPGVAPSNLQPTKLSRIRTAVFLMLNGKNNEAREELKSIGDEKELVQSGWNIVPQLLSLIPEQQ